MEIGTRTMWSSYWTTLRFQRFEEVFGIELEKPLRAHNLVLLSVGGWGRLIE